MSNPDRGARPSLGTVAVALLVVAAGCSGLDGGERTPYAAPDQTVGTADGGPPGVANGSVERPFQLVQSHVGALSLSSFAVVRERTVTAADGTVVNRRRVEARVSRDRQQFLLLVERAGATVADSRRLVYASVGPDSSRGVRQDAVVSANVTAAGGVSSARRLTPGSGDVVYPTDVLSRDPTHRTLLYRYLSVADRVVVTPLAPGEGPDADTTAGTRYRVTARTTQHERLLAPDANATVSDVSVTFVADADGVVVELRVEYVLVRGDDRYRVTDRVAYPAIGDVTVERPAWFDEALDRADETTTSEDEEDPGGDVRDPGDDGETRGRAPTEGRPRVAR